MRRRVPLQLPRRRGVRGLNTVFIQCAVPTEPVHRARHRQLSAQAAAHLLRRVAGVLRRARAWEPRPAHSHSGRCRHLGRTRLWPLLLCRHLSLAPTTLPTGAPAAAAAAAAVGPPLKVVLAAKLVAANDGGATTVHPKGRIATFLGAQTVDAAVTRFRALGSTGEQGEQWAFITSMESPAQEYLDGASLLSDLPLPAMPLPGGTSVRHDVLVRGRTLVTLCVRLPDAAAL